MEEQDLENRQAPGPAQVGGTAFRLAAGGFLVLGLWVCWEARRLTYYSSIGPGPGMLPLWLGILMALLAGAVLAGSFRPGGLPEDLPRLIPEPTPLLRIAIVLGGIGAFALLVERLGFVLTTFGMLLVLLLVHGCRFLPTSVLVALGGSLGVAVAFRRWLGVFLPPDPWGLLRFLGL